MTEERPSKRVSSSKGFVVDGRYIPDTTATEELKKVYRLLSTFAADIPKACNPEDESNSDFNDNRPPADLPICHFC